MVAVRLVFVVVVGCLAACATGPEVRPAPFRHRPDSVEPGSLRGPFSGRVLDGASRTPVAGAIVYATWTLESGSGLPVAAGFREHTVSTDAAGRYKIPPLSGVGRGLRVTDFSLVIYKRGFVAYRSDRRFADLGPRLDFAQSDNQVLLERWRADLSHARHLRYIGGGTAVAALTSWEAAEAAAELASGRRPGAIGSDLRPGQGEGPYLVAAQLLTEADIKARTRYDGTFETGPLGDEPDTASYSSQHFKALGRAETFDIALRMWRLDPGKAQEQYEELVGQLPGADERDEIASRSFRVWEGPIHGIGFLDGPRGIVVLLTCGQSQCSNVEDAISFGQTIHGRIKQLAPTNQQPNTPTRPLPTQPKQGPAAPAPAPPAPSGSAQPPTGQPPTTPPPDAPKPDAPKPAPSPKKPAPKKGTP